MRGLLFQDKIRINDYINIVIPTVKEILEHEELYFSIINAIVSTPSDMMVQLDDIGIDYTTINDWELFCLIFDSFSDSDTSLIFDNIDLSKYERCFNEQTQETVFYNRQDDTIIDRSIHYMICDALRNLHGYEKNTKKAANDNARKYMIEVARKKARAAARKRKSRTVQPESQLESKIIALVCSPECSYTLDSILNVSIYQFNKMFEQVARRVNFDNLMSGVYHGTIDPSGVDNSKLTWLATDY